MNVVGAAQPLVPLVLGEPEARVRGQVITRAQRQMQTARGQLLYLLPS